MATAAPTPAQVFPAPTINPDSTILVAAEGDEVTVTGTGFVSGVTTVMINNVTIPSTVNDDGTMITFIVPLGTPLGANTITITNPGQPVATGTLIVVGDSLCSLVAPPLVNFGLLAGTSVSNAGLTTAVQGLVGTFPGATIAGFPPGTSAGLVTGVPPADIAQIQAQLLYAILQNQTTDTNLPPALNNATVNPGVNTVAQDLALSGTITLDGNNQLNPVFVFQIPGDLNTSGLTIDLINGAQACNVFFQVGVSAFIQGPTTFVGTLVANDSIITVGISSITGRLISLNNLISVDQTTVSFNNCSECPQPTLV